MCQVDVLSYHCDRSSVYWIKIVLDSFKISNIKQQPWEHTATHTLVINADTIPPPREIYQPCLSRFGFGYDRKRMLKKKEWCINANNRNSFSSASVTWDFLNFQSSNAETNGIRVQGVIEGNKNRKYNFFFFFAGRECSPWKKNACWWIHKISHVTFLSNILPTSAK